MPFDIKYLFTFVLEIINGSRRREKTFSAFAFIGSNYVYTQPLCVGESHCWKVKECNCDNHPRDWKLND